MTTTSPRQIPGGPRKQGMGDLDFAEHCGSPGQHTFLVPSPIITRRTRTYSQTERARAGDMKRGKVKVFCRQKGHGFITPTDGSEEIFVHISDIEGEYVPKPGDDVTYKQLRIPPRDDKYQAVHVKIIHLQPGIHETWSGERITDPAIAENNETGAY